MKTTNPLAGLLFRVWPDGRPDLAVELHARDGIEAIRAARALHPLWPAGPTVHACLTPREG